jgi:hypothetical protein
VQSNALVAALIIFTFAAYERHHTALGSLTAVGRSSCSFHRRRQLRHLHPRKVRVALASSRPACSSPCCRYRHLAGHSPRAV